MDSHTSIRTHDHPTTDAGPSLGESSPAYAVTRMPELRVDDVGDATPQGVRESDHLDDGVAAVEHVSVAESSGPGVEVCEHPFLCDVQPATAASVRDILELVLVIACWPLSALPLVLAYGPRGAWWVMINLGLLPDRRWFFRDPRPDVAISRLARWCIFVMINVSTIAYAIALASWASLRPDGDVSYQTSSAMGALQLMSVGASLLTRRLAFATLAHNLGFLRISPCTRIESMSKRRLSDHELLGAWRLSGNIRCVYKDAVINGVSILREVGEHPPCAGILLPARTYEAVREAMQGTLAIRMMPSIAALRHQPGGEVVVRHPAGGNHVTARMVNAPSYRDVFASIMWRHNPPVSASDPMVWCDFTVTQVLIRDRAVQRFGVAVTLFFAVMLLGIVLSVAAPYVIRGSLGLRPFGDHALHSATFAALSVAELCLLFGMNWNSVFMLLWVGHSTKCMISLVSAACGQPPATPETSNVVPQQDPPPILRMAPLHLPFLPDFPRNTHTANQLERMRSAVPGALALDSVLAVRTTHDLLRMWIMNGSKGAAQQIALLSSISPTLAVFVASALALSFTISANSTSSLQIMQYRVAADAARQAAVVPTVTMLISFLSQCIMLLTVVAVWGGIVTELRRLGEAVHLSQCAAIATLDHFRHRLDTLERQHRVAGKVPAVDASAVSDDALAAGHDTPSVEELQHTCAELQVVIQAQRVLKEYITDQISDSAGMRLFGFLRPGTMSFGGVFAVMVSAATLASRLIAASSEAARV